MPRGEFFSQMSRSSILRRFSIGKLTEFMPQHLEKLVTRLDGCREIIKLPQSWYGGSVIWCHHQAQFLWKRGWKPLPKTMSMLEPVMKPFNNIFLSNEHLSFKQIVVVVDWGFTMLLTSQVISITFYSEHEKANKFCSETLFRLEVLLRAVNLLHGPTALFPFWRKSYSGLLRSEKICQHQPGLNPWTSEPVVSMITTGPPGSMLKAGFGTYSQGKLYQGLA